ncbi:MAG TPA: RNA-binding cell elongation regulator Jag/EloR [Acidimicrobiales bacterium]|nr:RNA-binding cell elongation regulator Jag/EloR [Acidimicrobiales bacterium]
MEWVETTGRTVEEAKDAALDQLGVDENDAEFEVLEETRHGLFGRIRSEARVRARVRPNRPRPKDDRRDRRRRSKGSGGGSAGRSGEDAGPATGESPAAAPTTGDARPAGSPAEVSADAERQQDSRPRAEKQRPQPAAPAAPTTAQGATMEDDVPLSEQADTGRVFLEGLLSSFGVRADVDIRTVDEDTVELSVSGDDLGLLIGPGGSTLTAVQEVTRTVVQRQTGGRNGRLLVDVAGYRQKRKAALERFTRSVAEQVKASGVAKSLEPMHAADRKIVHDTVNTIAGVATSSEGEEPRRRVVINPA